jgi:hypothetical protein
VALPPARHRKPPRSSRTRTGASWRDRRLLPIASALAHKPALVAAAAVALSALLFSVWPAAAHWLAGAANTAWADEADALGLQVAARLGIQVSNQPQVISQGLAIAPNYLNPVRDMVGMIPERIDEGVDFSGWGPVYAIGDGVVTAATGTNYGWPGGGWICYQLTDGPDAGLIVYVAEDITPAVQIGQQVTPFTVIGNVFNGGEGIETGWADPSSLTAEAQTAAAGFLGFFPTAVGNNFDALLQWLGVPPAPNAGQTGSGLLPANYPTKW